MIPRRAARVSPGAFLAVFLAAGAGRADEQPPPVEETPPPRIHRGRIAFEAGYAFERMLGLPVQRLDLGLTTSHRPWRAPIAVGLDLRFQPGRTEAGLATYRTELGLDGAIGGRIRLGLGPHLSHLMILRRTTSDAALKALFGNIGGIGLGLHATAAGDLLTVGRFSAVLGLRGLVEGYDGASLYGASAFLSAAID